MLPATLRLHLALPVVFSLASASLGGCGGEASCEDAAAAICAKACKCNDGCNVSFSVPGAYTGESVYGDEARCLDALQGSCGETGTEDVTDEEYDACSADAGDATCGEPNLEAPDSCTMFF